MKRFTSLLLIFLTLSFVSCEELEKILDEINLTEDEIIEGLKTALNYGTDTAVVTTSAVDGYYGDKLLKILLPSEAEVIVSNINSVPLGPELLENVILRINRSAEDAASEAKPIFINAITSMSISEGLTILQGSNPLDQNSSAVFDSTAATRYLMASTYSELVAAFSPKINASLNKTLVGNISTNSAWRDLTTAYNIYAILNGKSQVNSDLGAHVTEKALDGLLLKVGVEEKKIRKDPFQWASDILKKVFGSVMEE